MITIFCTDMSPTCSTTGASSLKSSAKILTVKVFYVFLLHTLVCRLSEDAHVREGLSVTYV